MVRYGRLAWMAAFAVSILLTISQAADAQREGERRGPGGRRFGGGFPSILRLATNEKVQNVLALSEEQKSKIEELETQFRDEIRRLLDDSGTEEGIQKLRDSTLAKLAGTLKEDQRKRLQEIAIQAWGAGAVLADPALAKELSVSDEQQSKLRDVWRSSLRDRFRAMRDAAGDDRRAKQDELQAKADKALLEVLTPEQQEKLAALKGEKADIDMSELRVPARGFFDGRGGRGRGERGDQDRDRDDADSDKDKSA
jgi:Spy/CpxP family protein refolding chaperone